MIIFMNMLNNLNCKIYLINSGFDLKSNINIKEFQKIISDKLLVYLREPFSIKNFKKYYNHSYIFQPDFLYLIKNNIDKYRNKQLLNRIHLVPGEYIVLGGNSNYYRSDRPTYNVIDVYTQMIKYIRENTNMEIILYGSSLEEVGWLTKISQKSRLRFYHVNNMDWKNAFVLLSNAYISISGRYHPTIMSLIGLTPSLMFSANHCKMEGVNEMFFPNQKVINSHEIHNNYQYIVDFIKRYKNPQEYIMSQNNIKKQMDIYIKLLNSITFE